MEEKKEKRGGRREGSGRIKIDSKKILLNLELDLYEALKDLPNKTAFINDAVRYAFKETNQFGKFAKQMEERRKQENEKKKEERKEKRKRIKSENQKN